MQNARNRVILLSTAGVLGLGLAVAVGCTQSSATSSETPPPAAQRPANVPADKAPADKAPPSKAGPAATALPANPLRQEGPPGAAAKPGWGKGKHSGVPFDPIKENGQFFVDWPKPRLALVFTGCRNGYIEPCGCAGKERMKGGVSRLDSFLRELREKRGWPTVALDVGGLSKGFGLQGVLKFHAIVDAMRKIRYDAVALGASDLKVEIGDLVSVAAGVDGKPGMFISSNVGLLGFDAGFTGQPRIVEAGGLKVGVVAILGKEFQKQIHSTDLAFADPESVAAKQAAELKDKCDLLVLLSHASPEESTAIAKKVQVFHFVVTAGGAAEPPARPTTIEGTKSWLIEVGEKAMSAVVVAVCDDAAQPYRYQRVILDSRYPDTEAMKQIMVAYQEQLKDLGLEGLRISPVPYPHRDVNGGYVGSKECESCHEPSYKVWKKSGHRKAWETLVKLDPPRTHDPECISCHVIGWHPTRYFPYEGGYESLEKTPKLIDVGCEDCHGPGEYHVIAENGADEAKKITYRKAVVITKEESKKTQCATCHDLENSPDFDFDTYWPYVEHYED